MDCNKTRKRMGIYVDLHNIVKGASDMGMEVDWIRFRKSFSKAFEIESLYVFDSKPLDEKRRKLHNHLKGAGFKIVYGGYDRQARCQKEVDVEMALRIYDDVRDGKIDVAAIASGDRDFAPVIRRSKEKSDVKFVCMSFRTSMSNEIMQLSDEYEYVENVIDSDYCCTA